MAPSRRSVLVGLGGLVAGGGALLGTGAFTTVQAERTVSVETAGDADAFLALTAGENSEYVDTSGDTIQITLDGSSGADGSGLNQNAITTIRDLVDVANNGSQDVTSLELEFTETPSGVDPADTFTFTIDDPDGSDYEASVGNGSDILTGNNTVPDTLGVGDAIAFGIEVDLIDGGDGNDLPDGGSYTLTITAETA